MIGSPKDITDLQSEAAAWLVRIHAPDVTPEDLQALTAWLDRSPAHLAAMDLAESAWAQAELLQRAEPQASREVIAFPRRTAPARKRSWMSLPYAASAALTVAGLGAGAWLLGQRPVVTDYAAPPGQARQATLRDGTQLSLAGGARLVARLSPGKRLIELQAGRVSLAVLHDPKRPLTLTAGDVLVRDIGTRFEVDRENGLVRVAVQEGSVSLSLQSAPPGAGAQVLRSGQGAEHVEGRRDFARIGADGGSAAKAVFKDEPLSQVVADLNRHFATPLVVDEAVGRMRVTAVFNLDSETAVVRSLESILPIEATTTPDSITLHPRR